MPTPTVTPAAAARVGIEIGEAAPELALLDLDDNPVSLSALRGRPVWLMFWAPGCAGCEVTLVEADRIEAENGARDLAVVSVAVSTSSEWAEAYASALDLTYPVAMDEDGRVFTRYRGVTLPTHVWIDRDGVIRASAAGEVPPEELAAGVAKIVAEPAH